jgi:hypothetical protein
MLWDTTIKNQNQIVSFEVLKAMFTKVQIFWDTKPCILVGSYRRFGKDFCLSFVDLIIPRKLDYSGLGYGGTTHVEASVLPIDTESCLKILQYNQLRIYLRASRSEVRILNQPLCHSLQLAVETGCADTRHEGLLVAE